MEEKDQANKLEQEIKAIETQLLIEKDRQDQEQLKKRHIERTRGLLGATTKNKEVFFRDNILCLFQFFVGFSLQLMENKWDFDQWNRVHQWHVDRAILADDPVNWSKTLT